ncbi:hypothetical protein CJF32_00000679 [Rutstroemia sp. NJR-2017a WRK4]|nr:hypothetical protein CJF32_00000679 [Rutstroemia sp. NJR-2017a WRK4]
MSNKLPPLSTPHSLHTHLLNFLTLSIHTILHSRSLYPRSTFLLTRAYNFPIPQSRHPSVCAYISSCISAITPYLQKGSISDISLVVFSPSNECLERYVFDVSRFPVVPKEELFTEFEGTSGELRTVDVEEELRAVLRRLSYSAGKLEELPEECTWSVVMEMKEDADAPIGHFEPSPAELQVPDTGKGKGKGKEVDTGASRGRVGRDRGGVKSTAIRAVEVGEFVMEAWIEEAKAKFDSQDE